VTIPSTTGPVDGERPVRVGAQLQPQHAEYADIRRAVAEAEEIGVDVVFTWDHFFPLYGDPDGKHFECWTILGAWAEATEHVEIGALVTCNSYRNPDLLADMARTVDHISGGRLILGIGAGWCERDYASYGYEFGTPGRRLDALGEALPRIKKRFHALNPAPTREIPVLVGGGGERKTLRHTATYADIWHGFGNVETITHKHQVLDTWCRDVGRNPREIERSAKINNGDLDFAPGLYAAGTRLFTMSATGPAYDLGELRELVAWRDAVNRGQIRSTEPPGPVR
jgi:probable F420-dependent oxidoreductase